MPNVVIVYLTALGEPETGLWCHRCSLPSGIRVRYGVSSPTSPMGLGVVERCVDCLEPL